jgi:SAM-dependent methyltransferase
VAVSWASDLLECYYGGAAALYERGAAPLERAGAIAIRARLAGSLAGRVIEIGCGTGLNFPHYIAEAEVTATELRHEFGIFAMERAQVARTRIAVSGADAQQLPFADARFDAALATLVFCSVPDPLRGLRELRRVLRPGAPAHFLEHVRSPRQGAALVQVACNPLWRWFTDGCELVRDTVSVIELAGFTIDDVRVCNLPIRGAALLPMREVYARA